MTDLVEQMARAIVAKEGRDFDEVCGVVADPDEGYCDSSTCVAAHWEEHDSDDARDYYRHTAQAILPFIEAAKAEGRREMREEEQRCPQCGVKFHLILDVDKHLSALGDTP